MVSSACVSRILSLGDSLFEHVNHVIVPCIVVVIPNVHHSLLGNGSFSSDSTFFLGSLVQVFIVV